MDALLLRLASAQYDHRMGLLAGARHAAVVVLRMELVADARTAVDRTRQLRAAAQSTRAQSRAGQYCALHHRAGAIFDCAAVRRSDAATPGARADWHAVSRRDLSTGAHGARGCGGDLAL